LLFVSIIDAMRFCNWVHNGALPGGDTEDGAYTLIGGGVSPSNAATVTRNPGAKVCLPTEDEWYKAAYYQPSSQGGDSDSYWEYPTMSNVVPTKENPPGGNNSANYGRVLRGPAVVGMYSNSPSYYGTFDQAGNAFEWTETIDPSSNWRVWRGGDWDVGPSERRPPDAPTFTRSAEFNLAPPVPTPGFNVGFRVVAPVP